MPPPGRNQDSDESKKGPPVSPQTTPVKSPGKRGAGKDSPKSPAPPVMVCRTVQNLPLDHASMCRMAFEEAPPPPPVNKRSRGRPRTTSLSASSCHSLREDDDEEESEQRLRLREQLGASSLLQLASASTTDLSVLADVALKMDPDAADSEETETSDEAEEQKMEEALFSPESLALVMSSEGVTVLMEHNYCKPPVVTAPPGTKRTSTKDSVLLPADLSTISGVLEAPEEVIGEAIPSRGDPGEYVSAVGVLCDSEDVGQALSLPPTSKKMAVGKGVELEKDINKKRRRKDKENLEVHHPKKQKEQPGRKQRKRTLEVRERLNSSNSTADESVSVALVKHHVHVYCWSHPQVFIPQMSNHNHSRAPSGPLYLFCVYSSLIATNYSLFSQIIFEEMVHQLI